MAATHQESFKHGDDFVVLQVMCFESNSIDSPSNVLQVAYLVVVEDKLHLHCY